MADVWGSAASLLAAPVRTSNLRDLHNTEDLTWTANSDEAAELQQGWRIELKIDPAPSPDGRYHSGDSLTGSVRLVRQDPAAPKIVSAVTRLFWQSTCLYKQTTFVTKEAGTSKVKAMSHKLQPQMNLLEKVTRTAADWHRGYAAPGEAGLELWHGGHLDAIATTIDADFPHLNGANTGAPDDDGLGPPPPEALHDEHNDDDSTMPFAFTLPTRTKVRTASRTESALPSRRQLQLFARTPPPSSPAPEIRIASVEWVVEVLVTLQREPDSTANERGELGQEDEENLQEEVTSPADELPTFQDATTLFHGAVDMFGMVQPSESTLIVRRTFSFEPSDQHNQSLHTSWRPSKEQTYIATMAQHQGIPIEGIWDETPVNENDVVPSLGKDVRTESLGGIPIGTRGTVRSSMVQQEGGRAAWYSFEKRLPMRSFGKLVGSIRAEGSVPRDFLVSRNAEAIPIILHLSYDPPPGAEKIKNKHVTFTHVTASLSMRLTLQAGSKTEPAVEGRELRKMQFSLQDAFLSKQMTRLSLVSTRSNTAPGDAGTGSLKLALGQTLETKLLFEMQSDLPPVETCQNAVKLKDCGLSFRTPNIEREYVLTARLHTKDGEFFFLRTLVQVIASHSAPPSFESVVSAPPEYQ